MESSRNIREIEFILPKAEFGMNENLACLRKASLEIQQRNFNQAYREISPVSDPVLKARFFLDLMRALIAEGNNEAKIVMGLAYHAIEAITDVASKGEAQEELKELTGLIIRMNERQVEKLLFTQMFFKSTLIKK